MAITKIHARQVLSRDILSRLLPDATTQELDDLLRSINSEITPVFELRPTSTPSLTVNIGSRVVTNSEFGGNKTMPPIKLGVPNLGASPNVVFPSVDGGNIVASPGNTIALNCPTGQYTSVMIAIKKDNTIFVSQGTPQASATVALDNAPKIKTGTVPLGIVVVQNVSGTIQNIQWSSIYQFGNGGGGGGGAGGGSTFDVIAGENIPARTPVYISVGAADGGRNAGQVYIVNPANALRKRFVGVTEDAVTAGQEVTVWVGGLLEDFTGLTPGVPVFWDGTAYQFTEPSLSDVWCRIGVVHSATAILIENDLGVRVPNSSDLVTVDANQTIQNKRYENAQLTLLQYNEVTVNSTLTGSNAQLDPQSSVIILTNSSLQSIEMIVAKSLSSPTSAGKLVLVNRTGGAIRLLHEQGTTAANRINTGTGQDFALENGQAAVLYYDTNNSRWLLASDYTKQVSEFSVVAGENIGAFRPVYVSKGNANGDSGRIAGQAYIVDPTNDHRMEFIGINRFAANSGDVIVVQTMGKMDIPASLIAGGSFVNGEMVYWTGTQFTTTIPTNTNFWLIKVGKAFSNTGMVINPDLGASAIYVPATPNVLTINNNVTSPTNIGLSFNPSIVSAFKIHYQVTRVAGSTEIVESGLISGHYNSTLGQWTLVNYGISSDAGVDFSMIGNNVAYTSSNMTGSPYSGSFRYRIETEINPGLDFNATIANNVTSPTNVTGMFMQPSSRAMSIFYMVRRTAGSTEIAEAGIINLVRNVTASTCDISVSGISGDADVSFDVTSGGQVRYTTSNMTGSPYSGNIWWEVLSEL